MHTRTERRNFAKSKERRASGSEPKRRSKPTLKERFTPGWKRVKTELWA